MPDKHVVLERFIRGPMEREDGWLVGANSSLYPMSGSWVPISKIYDSSWRGEVVLGAGVTSTVADDGRFIFRCDMAMKAA